MLLWEKRNGPGKIFMKDRYFIDTNILVYANDKSEKDKYNKAKKLLLNGIINENIAVSAQVLSEFYVTVTQKIKKTLPADIAKKEIQLFKAVDIIDIDFHLIIKAINISHKHSLSYWDSLIVAAAQKAKCNILYTEDMNPDQTIDSVTIKNPL